LSVFPHECEADRGVDADSAGTFVAARVTTEDRSSDLRLWRERLAVYAKPDSRRGARDVATSVVPYVALTSLMYVTLDVSLLLTFAIAVPAAGFLVRTFIVFHDCAHGSFLPSRRANVWLGTACGLLVYSPFRSWRHEHAVHHATAGDLDRRGKGDVDTLTVSEYAALSWPRRLAYRLFRNPLVMLGVGPIWALLLYPRLVPSWARGRYGRAIIATDVALAALVGGLCAAFGWPAVVLVQLPTAMLAGAAGIGLFYVQHQFEGVYWQRHGEWSYADASLRGSSHLRLPSVLQFFTGNIGLHHVHHLNAAIPNYNLQRAHDENEIFDDVPELTLWDGLRAFGLKLYDEESGRLVTFAQARARNG
jgi:omega-6 fatty acid desaturase (delta-12 desaturase)